MLHKCGEHADLMLETLVRRLSRKSPADIFVEAQMMEQLQTGRMAVLHRPLLLALQVGRAECSRCSPLGRLSVQSCSQSGSSIEGLTGLPLPKFMGTPQSTIGSDTDIMLEFGPVRWAESGRRGGAEGEAGKGVHAVPDSCSHRKSRFRATFAREGRWLQTRGQAMFYG